METEENKDLVRRFYQEAIRERDAGAGDLVAAYQRWVGTHEGEFLGIGGTGRRVEFISTAVLRVGDGLIVQVWDEMDSGAILNQLVT